MVVAGQIEFLSCRAHSAWLIGKLELVDVVNLVAQANKSRRVFTATRARQVNYESSPVEPELLVVFAGKLVRLLYSKSPSILLATWWYCCGFDFSLILCAR